MDSQETKASGLLLVCVCIYPESTLILHVYLLTILYWMMKYYAILYNSSASFKACWVRRDGEVCIQRALKLANVDLGC